MLISVKKMFGVFLLLAGIVNRNHVFQATKLQPSSSAGKPYEQVETSIAVSQNSVSPQGTEI